jgi:hypothetical protein
MHKKILLLGSGELGKELVIALKKIRADCGGRRQLCRCTSHAGSGWL